MIGRFSRRFPELMRRAQRYQRLGGGPLFAMSDLTWTRSSEKAHFDPRTSTFVQKIGDGSVTIEDSSDVNAFYTNQGVGLIVTDNVDGVADEVEDPDGAIDLTARGTVNDARAITGGTTLTWSVKVKQDAITSRFPVFYFQEVGAGDTAALALNTQTGAFDTDGTYATATVTDDGSGYWTVTMARVLPVGLTQVRFRLSPAANSVLDASTTDGTVTGSVIVKETLITHDNVAWLPDDTACILADGSVLTEESRTNLVPSSNDMSSSWGAINATVSASATPAPDGGTAYDVIDPDASSGGGRIQDTISATVTGEHRYSFFVEQGTGVVSHIMLLQGSGAFTGGSIQIQVDTDTGGTATIAGTPTALYTESAEGGTYWRVIVGADVSTTGGFTNRIYPAYASTLGGALVNAETGGGVLWGVQMEAGSFPTSPIRTSGSPATRAEETPYLPGPLVPDTMRFGIWSFEFQPLFDGDVDEPNYLILDVDSANNNNMRSQGGIAGRWRPAVNSNEDVQNLTDSFSAMDVCRWEIDWTAYTWAFFANDTEDTASPFDSTADHSPDFWPLGDLYIANAVGGGSPFSGVIYPPQASDGNPAAFWSTHETPPALTSWTQNGTPSPLTDTTVGDDDTGAAESIDYQFTGLTIGERYRFRVRASLLSLVGAADVLGFWLSDGTNDARIHVSLGDGQAAYRFGANAMGGVTSVADLGGEWEFVYEWVAGTTTVEAQIRPADEESPGNGGDVTYTGSVTIEVDPLEVLA